MIANPRIRRALVGLALVILLGLAWTGVAGGLQQLPESQSSGQRIQTFAQIGYGVFGFLAILTVFWGQAAALVFRFCWVAALTIAAALAPVVWGEAGWSAGLLAGLVALLIGLGVLWLLNAGPRRINASTNPP